MISIGATQHISGVQSFRRIAVIFVHTRDWCISYGQATGSSASFHFIAYILYEDCRKVTLIAPSDRRPRGSTED